MRAGPERLSRGDPPGPALGGGPTHREGPGNDRNGLARLHRADDSFPEIKRICFHPLSITDRSSALGTALIESAQVHWRAVNSAHLVALVRAGAKFENGVLVE